MFKGRTENKQVAPPAPVAEPATPATTDAPTDDLDRRIAEAEEGVRSARRFREQAEAAVFRLRPDYLDAVNAMRTPGVSLGHVAPSVVIQRYRQAEAAVELANEEERTALHNRSRVRQEQRRREMLAADREIAERDAARQEAKQGTKRASLRAHVAEVLAGGGRQRERLFHGQRFSFADEKPTQDREQDAITL